MRPITFPLFLVLFILMSSNISAQIKCAAVEGRNVNIQNDDTWEIEKSEMEKTISNWINEHRNSFHLRAVLTIPVVVHVIYNSPAENISEEQIISQIDVLNQDFRAMNDDLSTIPNDFQPLVADVEIEFCLAAVDPDGNATTGITRTFTNNNVGIGGTSSIHFSNQGGHDAWDPERYLNIWVAKFAGGIGGISSFPGIGPVAEDGVEINYIQFGTINVEPPYHLGRTLTHEIGHYLNLEHPWGPELNDCCADDFVDDTPETCETYIGECPAHPVISCSMPDMFMNFMFYSNDACLNMFTPGQKLRMLATLNTMRPDLIESQTCEFVATEEPKHNLAIKISKNPVSGKLVFEIKKNGLIDGRVKIFDLKGNSILKSNLHFDDEQTIDLQGVVNGMYFLVVENQGRQVVRKFIVQK